MSDMQRKLIRALSAVETARKSLRKGDLESRIGLLETVAAMVLDDKAAQIRQALEDF